MGPKRRLLVSPRCSRRGINPDDKQYQPEFKKTAKKTASEAHDGTTISAGFTAGEAFLARAASTVNNDPHAIPILDTACSGQRKGQLR